GSRRAFFEPSPRDKPWGISGLGPPKLFFQGRKFLQICNEDLLDSPRMTRTTFALVAVLSLFGSLLPAAETFPIFSTNATWRLFKGRTEASSPDITSWRSNTFNDVAFTNAVAPFTYGEGYA